LAAMISVVVSSTSCSSSWSSRQTSKGSGKTGPSCRWLQGWAPRTAVRYPEAQNLNHR
jgi:hypothetical protein